MNATNSLMYMSGMARTVDSISWLTINAHPAPPPMLVSGRHTASRAVDAKRPVTIIIMMMVIPI